MPPELQEDAGSDIVISDFGKQGRITRRSSSPVSRELPRRADGRAAAGLGVHAIHPPIRFHPSNSRVKAAWISLRRVENSCIFNRLIKGYHVLVYEHDGF
jgi:hypothetical protein